MTTLSRRTVLGAATTSSVAIRPTVARAGPVTVLSRTHVAGTAYGEINFARDELSVGSSLVPRRDPGNRYDPLAVEILTPLGRKLGFLPRDRNEAVARLLDAGATVTVTIVTREEFRHDRTGELGFVEPLIDVAVILG